MLRAYHFGLAGWPLIRSLSPALHRAALRACGLIGEYELYRIPAVPAGEPQLADLLQRLRAGELDGLNLTVPHKLDIIPHLDQLAATAREVGAVNTIIRLANSLVGENTDAAGFWEDISPRLVSPAPQAALILGAGGAARAVVYALASHGWQVTVAAQRPEQAAALAAGFSHLTPPPGAAGQPLDDQAAWLGDMDANLVVNTSPLGMSPNETISPWPVGLPLPAACLVYDLVYDPPLSVFIRQARSQGLVAANGLGMLVNQAAHSFLLWTGLPEESLPVIRTAMQGAVYIRQ